MALPLLSPKPFAAFSSPLEYLDYIKSLYTEPVRPPAARNFGASVNKKGTLVLRVKREPKFLLASEIRLLAEEIGWSLQHTWVAVARKKDIEIRRG